MPERRESQSDLSRLQHLAREAGQKAWSKLEFPLLHTPDYERALQAFCIDAKFSERTRLRPHPHVRPHIMSQSDQDLAEADETYGAIKVAYYDPHTGRNFFAPEILALPDEELRRIVFYQIAVDIVGKAQTIRPAEYSQDQQSRIEIILQTAFDEKKRPPMEATHIEKLAFREVLTEGEFAISDLFGPTVLYLNELYPTTHEVVTDHIVRRGGDIEWFDRDARQGNLVPVGTTEHPLFENALYKILTKFDWRLLLDTLACNSPSGIALFLEERHVDGEAVVKKIIGLTKEFQKDEERLQTLSKFFK